MQEIKAILCGAPKDRLKERSQRLRELTSSLRFFQTLREEESEQAVFDVCKAMELRSFGESEVIVNIGMECLSHTVNVGVYVRQKHRDPTKEEQLILARVLQQGDWIGDASCAYQQGSLVNYSSLEDSTECASVVSSTAAFKKIICPFFLIQMTFQLNFLRDTPLFWGWSENDLKVLYSVFHTKKFEPNEPVFLQGDLPQNIYLVKQGTFKMCKFFEEFQNRKYQDLKYNTAIDRAPKPAKALIYYSEHENLQIASIERLELFGEEDFLQKTHRLYSVVCESEMGEVYVFSKSAFLNLIIVNDSSRSFIVQRNKNKAVQYKKRLDNISTYVSSARVSLVSKSDNKERQVNDIFSFSRNSSFKPSSDSSTTRSSLTMSCFRLDLPAVPISQLQPLSLQQPQIKDNNGSFPAKRSFGSITQQSGSGQSLYTSTRSSAFSINQKNIMASTTAAAAAAAAVTSSPLLMNANSHRLSGSMRRSLNMKSQNDLLASTSRDLASTVTMFNSRQQQSGGLLHPQKQGRQEEFMQKYYGKYHFNVIDKGYCERIADECANLNALKDPLRVEKYKRGGFNNKQGQRGFRSLGIDQPMDIDAEFEKAKLQVQEDFDPDFKIKTLVTKK